MTTATLSIKDSILAQLRYRTPLTVPEIWQAVGWSITVQEISRALEDLKREGLAEFVPLRDSGCVVPSWRKAGGR